MMSSSRKMKKKKHVCSKQLPQRLMFISSSAALAQHSQDSLLEDANSEVKLHQCPFKG
jgi:hypothetical protein